MARSVNLSKRVEKIKEGMDELYQEFLAQQQKEVEVDATKINISDIDFDSLSDVELAKIQQGIAKIQMSRARKNSKVHV